MCTHGFSMYLKRRVLKVVAIFAVLLLTLATIPIPEVGSPVEDLALPGSKFVNVDGIKIHYLDEGSGNCTLLLLHGFGASALSWRYVVGSLSSYCRVLAFDRPGFGLTERVDPRAPPYNPYTYEGVLKLTRRFMEKLNVTHPVVVGHSAGGGLALLLALEHPELVSALLLVAPAWKPRTRQWYEVVITSIPLLSDKYGPLLVRGLVGSLERVLRAAWYNKSLLTPEVEEVYKYPLKARNWDRGLYWILKYYVFPDIAKSLANLREPTLVVHGDRDELVPLASSVELCEKVNASLVVMEGVGHLPHEESPEVFVKYVVEFLNSLKVLQNRAQ
ncbi:MAG: alpha/beta hydrolase [Sulfolobales archaeon]|nr:alpha/beta hydrolase [Sulfolobales archaeon]MCX8208547.1 alpha/beta hydrolase [Sulfolobales archaeon]MDW8010415.1 alpha/beta hydrolase [Sulfolobales archaeon]